MKKVLFALLLLPLFAAGQILRTDSSQLNFGVTLVGTTDSVPVTILNRATDSTFINNVKFYSIYGHTPFSVKENSFTIAPNQSKMLWVYFTPEQNILHNSQMVIQHTGTSGHEAVPLIGQGRFPLAYYNNTENLEEEALKTALKTRTGQGYIQLSYNAARDAMFMTIDNEAVNGGGATTNTLECVYTGFNKTGYTSRSNAQSTSPQFNTEHTFPQGFFNSNLPMRSDIHHLFPTTNNSNSQRGNKPFGTVSNGTPVTLGGGSFFNSTTFEPRNAQKGRTARAMMYFVIRYLDYSNHFSGQETILRNWHSTYPVDAVEQKRNNDIFAVQGNRNPFVDYPQLEERITNFVSNSVAPVQFGLDVLQPSIDFGSFFNATPDTFDYVLVNRGNQAINFSNFSLSNTNDLSFAQGSGVNTSINPGDAIEISIIANTNTTTSLNENLTFSTNMTFPFNSFTVPITGNSIPVGLNENNLSSTIEVFPNPIQDQLFIQGKGKETLNLIMRNVSGKEIPTNINEQNNTISTQSLPKGIYFLEISNGKERLVKKLIK